MSYNIDILLSDRQKQYKNRPSNPLQHGVNQLTVLKLKAIEMSNGLSNALLQLRSNQRNANYQ